MKLPRVLNTRPREQAAELSRLLEAAGFLAVEAPAIEIVPAWAPAELARVREQHYDWTVLASANGGRELDLSRTRVVCGTTTARVLGITAEIALDRFSAAAALDAVRTRLSPGARVLVPRAAEGRPELVDGLRALGALVDAPVAYRTVVVDDAARRLARGDIDVVTVCSPSAVASTGPHLGRAQLVALGETTAEAARASGLRVDAVARQTSMAALVMAVRSVRGGVAV